MCVPRFSFISLQIVCSFVIYVTLSISDAMTTAPTALRPIACGALCPSRTMPYQQHLGTMSGYNLIVHLLQIILQQKLVYDLLALIQFFPSRKYDELKESRFSRCHATSRLSTGCGGAGREEYCTILGPVTRDMPAEILVLATSQSSCELPKFFGSLALQVTKKFVYQSHDCQMNSAPHENLCDNHDISAFWGAP